MDMAFKDYTHWCTLLDETHCCVVVSNDKTSNEQCMQGILTTCQNILEVTDSSSCIKVYLGVSGIVDSPWNFRQAYEQALHALSHHVLGNHAISFFVEGFLSGEPEIKAIQSVIDQIINSVKLGKKQSSIEYVNALFDLLVQTKSPFRRIRDITVFVASSLVQLLPNIVFELQNEIGSDGDSFSRIFKTNNTDKLKNLLGNLALIVANKLIKSEHHNNVIINKVNEYISQNYKKNIRLSDIAECVYVNSSYLSRLFRQETGNTLTEVIARYRMEKAKEFLIKPEIKTYEVANLIGIEDSAYFSMLFKRYTGVSPTEYRQMAIKATKE